MKWMSGEIGSLLLDNRQVGGFKGWTAITDQNTNQSRVIAPKFWLLEHVDTDYLDAEFYSLAGDMLKLIHRQKVKVDVPDCELDTMTDKSLMMVIDDFDWLKD